MVANDPILGNQEGDDLYTAGLGIEVQRGFRFFQGGERMFTDREAGQRFDETYLSVEERLPSWGSWEPTVGLGVLHIGQGLPRAIGAELDPPGGRQRNLRFRLSRTQSMVRRAAGAGAAQRPARPRAPRHHRHRAAQRPGFRSWLRAMTSYEAPFGSHFSWRAGLGLHAEEAELNLLERNVEKLAPAAELGIAWRSLTLLWSYNDLGTATSHLVLGMNIPLKVLDGVVSSARPRR